LTNLFQTRLASSPFIVADGATGTMLYERSGAPFDRHVEQFNFSDPQLVLQLHLDYIAAGAELIETNTFGVTNILLASKSMPP